MFQIGDLVYEKAAVLQDIVIGCQIREPKKITGIQLLHGGNRTVGFDYLEGGHETYESSLIHEGSLPEFLEEVISKCENIKGELK